MIGSHDINPETGREYYWDCNDCNYDLHTCGGCGEYVGHGKYACEECKKL